MWYFETYTIGTGGDYATLSAFATAFTNTLISRPFTTVLVKLKSQVFDEWGTSITIPSNCFAFRMTAENGDEYHKGVLSNTGPILRPVTQHSSGSPGLTISTASQNDTQFIVLDKFAIDGDSNFTSASNSWVALQFSSIYNGRPFNCVCDKLLVTAGTVPRRSARAIVTAGRPVLVSNCLLYGLNATGVAGSFGAYAIGGDERLRCYFNTIDEISYPNGTSPLYGIDSIASSTTQPFAGYQGNIITNISAPTSSTAQCFDANAITASDYDYNICDDGVTGQTQSTSAAEFTNAGTRDYSLAAGAAAEAYVPSKNDSLTAFPDFSWFGVDFFRDITNQIRAAGSWDAGCFNNLSGYASEPSGSPSSFPTIGPGGLVY